MSNQIQGDPKVFRNRKHQSVNEIISKESCLWDSLQVHSADVSQSGLSRTTWLQKVVGLQNYGSHTSNRRTVFMLYGHRNQGAGTLWQVCLP